MRLRCFKYSFFTVLLLFGFEQFAQDRELKVNFIGGLNSAKLKDSLNMQRGSYIFFGFNNNISLNSKSSLNIDVQFAQRGGKYSQPVKKYVYDYLEVPFYYQYEAFKDLRFGVGVRASYLMRARRGYLDGGQSTGIGYETINKPEIFNGGYVITLHSKLQKNTGIFIAYDGTVSFSHLTMMHQDFRFGFTYNITAYQFVRQTDRL